MVMRDTNAGCNLCILRREARYATAEATLPSSSPSIDRSHQHQHQSDQFETVVAEEMDVE